MLGTQAGSEKIQENSEYSKRYAEQRRDLCGSGQKLLEWFDVDAATAICFLVAQYSGD